MNAAPETLLCFDFGERRIGVALGNSLTGTARSLAIVEEPVNDRRFEKIAKLIAEWQPQRLVVGRPLLEDGTPSPTTLRCERFARQLHGRFGLPVESVDERFSSLAAQSFLGSRNLADDAQAAAIILRQYLDEHRHA